ncbi:MAG: ATP-binding cassette domain-containing protein [Kineosporiaceae bacterium]
MSAAVAVAPGGRGVRTPLVAQMEDQDCGAACLAMVLGGFGRPVTLLEATRACGVSRDGVSAASVARAAARYGLLARGRRLVRREDRAWLGLAELPLPAMALVEGPHFVVVERRRRGRLDVNDPALGRYRLTPAEFWQRFEGVAVGFAPGPDFAPVRRAGAGRTWQDLRDLAARLSGRRGAVALAVALGVLLTVPSLLPALALRAVAGAGAAPDAWGTGVAAPAALLAAICAVLVVAGTWVQQRVLGRALESLATASTTGFLHRLLRLPGAFFARRQLGGLVTRVQMNDGLASLLTGRAAAVGTAAVAAAVHLAALVALDPVTATVPMAVAVLDVVAVRVASARRAALTHRLTLEQHRRDGVAFAAVAGIETVRAGGREAAVFRSWITWQARALTTTQAISRAVLAPTALPSALPTLAAAASVVLGWYRVGTGAVDVGTVLAFLLLLNGFLLPVTTLAAAAGEVAVATAESTLLRDVEEAEPDPVLVRPARPADGGPVPRLRGDVELRGVSFGYDPNRPPVLAGIDLRLRAGERVAVVGPSGGGKSTLARLVAGVLRPTAGEVLLDGTPRDAVPRPVTVASIGYVQQGVRLFDGSIRDNLTLWDDAVPDDALWAALADAGAEAFVRARGGLDVPLEEDGRGLSGGERQRLEIARVLAGDPRVLVLDEATAALDPCTEAHVGASLRRRGATCLLLAHRLDTVRGCDRVVVLQGGRIVQEGPPARLAAVDGPFRTLLEEQP